MDQLAALWKLLTIGAILALGTAGKIQQGYCTVKSQPDQDRVLTPNWASTVLDARFNLFGSGLVNFKRRLYICIALAKRGKRIVN